MSAKKKSKTDKTVDTIIPSIMSLQAGANTIVDQCLKIREDEEVLVLNDGNDKDLINSLLTTLKEKSITSKLIEYEAPENQGSEPPENVSQAMKEFDVVIAPTMKSLSHTRARKEANKVGTRVATLPTINKQVWNGALQADYEKVKEITDKAMEKVEEVEDIRVETPRGTKLEIKVNSEKFIPSNGIVSEKGEMGNIPSGEIFTAPLSAEGKLVLGPNNFGNKDDVGDKLIIENGKVTEIKDAPSNSPIKDAVEDVEGADNIAEFGFGTNPEAEFISHTLQDEKILGTVHIALGDNSFGFDDGDDRLVESNIHWDFILQKPTVWFDDEKVLDNGEPIFLD